MKIDDQQRIVEIWQTQADLQDEVLQYRLKGMYADWKMRKFLVAVYRSGNENLYINTRDLLICNRLCSAEKAVQREKQSGVVRT